MTVGGGGGGGGDEEGWDVGLLKAPLPEGISVG